MTLGAFLQMAKPGSVSTEDPEAISTSLWLLIRPLCICSHPLGRLRLPDLLQHLPLSSRMIGQWIKTRPWALSGLAPLPSTFGFKMNQWMMIWTKRSVISWMHLPPLHLHFHFNHHHNLQPPPRQLLTLHHLMMTLQHHLQIYLKKRPLQQPPDNMSILSTDLSLMKTSRPREPDSTYRRPSATDHHHLHFNHLKLHRNHFNLQHHHCNLHLNHRPSDLNDDKTKFYLHTQPCRPMEIDL